MSLMKTPPGHALACLACAVALAGGIESGKAKAQCAEQEGFGVYVDCWVAGACSMASSCTYVQCGLVPQIECNYFGCWWVSAAECS